MARRYRTTVTDRGARFVSNFEGGRSPDGKFHPYWDAHGRVWTIGFGHTKGVTRRSKPLTLTQARALLRRDLNAVYAPPVAKLTKSLGLKLEQHEFNALVSAVYNLGPGILDRGRTLGDALRSEKRMAIADAFLPYDKADGQRLLGLTRRRKAERAMYLTGKDLS